MKSKTLNPYDKRFVKVKKTSTKADEKAVRPVAKDTNKTRRRMVRPAKRK